MGLDFRFSGIGSARSESKEKAESESALFPTLRSGTSDARNKNLRPFDTKKKFCHFLRIDFRPVIFKKKRP